MLTHYRKENRKIAMGLLSFHKKLTGKTLLKEIDTYESEDDYELFSLRQKVQPTFKGLLVFTGQRTIS